MAGGHRFATLAGGTHTACGVDAAGRAFCWGYNGYGQVGTGSKEVYRPIPTPVSAALVFAGIAVGDHHTCGWTTAGVAYCWGRNDHGELGTGNGDEALVPTAVHDRPRRADGTAGRTGRRSGRPGQRMRDLGVSTTADKSDYQPRAHPCPAFTL